MLPTDLVSGFISPCFCAAFKAGEVTEKTTGAFACSADLQRQSPTLCNISSPAAVGVRGSVVATLLQCYASHPNAEVQFKLLTAV